MAFTDSGVFNIQVPADDELALAAQSLGDGEWVDFAPGLDHLMGSPSGATGLERLEWQARFFNDEAHGLIHLLGKSAANQGGPTDWRHRTYVRATNTWQNNDPSILNSSGHIYATWDIDPATGDLYGVLGTGNAFYRWNYATQAYVQISSDISVAAGRATNPPGAGVWHPNLFGVGDGGFIASSATSGNTFGNIYYRKSTGAFTGVSLALSLSNNVSPNTSAQGAYFEAIDKAIVGRERHILVTGGVTPTFTDAGNAPIRTMGTATSSSAHGVVMQHPNNPLKMLILSKLSSKQTYESTDGDTWTQVANHPFVEGVGDPITWCSIPDIGCIWGIGATSATVFTSRLYKPAP
jgi:hypothetical protein